MNVSFLKKQVREASIQGFNYPFVILLLSRLEKITKDLVPDGSADPFDKETKLIIHQLELSTGYNFRINDNVSKENIIVGIDTIKKFLEIFSDGELKLRDF